MGTAGHMKHPFDVPSVNSGKDLIKYFNKIKEHLGINPASVKFDGYNVSFKLVTNQNGEKEFRADRGTSLIKDVQGMTAEDAAQRWSSDHDMPSAIKTILEIFNNTLPLIKEELTTLGMWDDPTKFFNAEFVNKKTNVLEYKNNFIAIHGINQFYEKKAQPHRIKSGESMNRPGLPRIDDSISLELKYDNGAFSSLLEKVKKHSDNFEIYGDVPTKLIKEITFKDILDTNFTVCFRKNSTATHTLREWLSNAVNPRNSRIKTNEGKKLYAISKSVYLKVLNQEPLMEIFNSSGDVKQAINGALFNHATRLLGNEIKKSLTSNVGDVVHHEGIVLRNLENYPVKVTGEFIIDGMNSVFNEKRQKKTIAIYSGRFQPMGKHHLQTFNAILEMFGKENTFLATSGKVEFPISPFTFEEKKNIMMHHGIDEKHIVEVKNPYNVTEVLKNYDPTYTDVVYLVGSKDMEDNPRFKVTEGTTKDGYNWKIQTMPRVTIDIEGAGEMSGTSLREALKDANENIFENIMGWYDQGVHNMIKNKLNRLEETQMPLGIFLRLIEEFIEEEEELEEISAMGPAAGPGAVEGYAGKKPKRTKKKEDEYLIREDELIEEVMDYLLSKLGVPL